MMISIHQARWERVERLGKTSRLEILGLKVACLAVLGVALACALLILFHAFTLWAAIAVAAAAGLAAWPLFVLGRRHARWAGNKCSAGSYRS
jgi:hypothetical protein